MSAPPEAGTISLRLVGSEARPLRSGVFPQYAVSVLFDTDLDAWRRGWRGTDRSPVHEGVVVAGETTRSVSSSGAQTTHVLSSPRIAYTLLGEPDSSTPVIAAVEEFLNTADDVAPTVFIDDITSTRMDRSACLAFLEAMVERVASAGGSLVIGCTPGSIDGVVLDRLIDVSTTVRMPDVGPIEAVERLRRNDPTTFGYVRQHWIEAGCGIEACDRNYPQAKQVHSCLSDPNTTSRTLGMALSGLASLSVIRTWGDTVGSTRYDLTTYDRAALTMVGLAFGVATDRLDIEQ
ncbi:hypothetical protein [Halorubrum vacuolatum]|uniref:Uncharacterized protein n=1 Tax=Halorubrum vacuolatum TaxID=63740 RepID=A0A238VFE8_HALVU|nr:hypothetical protein [Halorubrum vacuolatum]SNR32898.1 hypothetical protein SAMN06264855_102360 [Halorubrum vacuolatum]